MMMNKLEKVSASLKRARIGHEFFLFLIFVVGVIVISLVSGNAWSFESFLDILKSSSTHMVMAIGVLLVMVSGGMDVSFSSIAAVTAYATIHYLNQTGSGNIIQAFFIASLIGITLGAINAVLISLFKLPALIVTLATSNIFFGILLQVVPTAHISQLPRWVSDFGSGRVISFVNNAGQTYGLSNLAFVVIILLILFWFILRFTSIGRNIYAVGSAPEAAKRAGISIWKTQFFIYCSVGFLAGISSILNASLIVYVNPFNIQAVTMDIIAAVVLGGASLTGGKGSVPGTFLGVLLLFLIKSSLIQLGVPSTWDSVIVGSVLIISIAITMLQDNKHNIRKHK